MVKYGLFAAQQAQDRAARASPAPSSTPVLFPGVDARCSSPSPCWPCLVVALFMGRLRDLFSLHPPSQADFPRSPFCLWGSKSGGNSRAGRFQLGTLGFPREEKHVLVPAWPLLFRVGHQSGFCCLHTSSSSLIPPSCCLFAEQQLREDNSVMKALHPNFQVWPTRSIRHFGKIKNFISNQPAFICLGINKAEEPAVATAAS